MHKKMQTKRSKKALQICVYNYITSIIYNLLIYADSYLYKYITFILLMYVL